MNKRQKIYQLVVYLLTLWVRVIRENIGLSQSNFAMLIGVSKRILENWEQGRRHPTVPAKALLRILAVDPKHVVKALHN